MVVLESVECHWGEGVRVVEVVLLALDLVVVLVQWIHHCPPY